MFESKKEHHIQKIKFEYKEQYHKLSWISGKDAIEKQNERQNILEQFSRTAGIEFHNQDTKISWGKLSPGCQICAAGEWSCLFISNLCNCKCFYCPTAQDRDDYPTTHTVSFREPNAYADYVEAFGYRGVSISGGEPLLVADRTLEYLQTVRDRFGKNVYTWLYTNGTLVNKEILKQLGKIGLDEIRFDIGATNFSLKKASMAVDFIENVTVEIPAIPEEEERLKELLPEMAGIGIKYLNLHQLRLTPFNYKNLANRNYTFLHGEKPTVLESEYAAFHLIQFAAERNINLGINYCSFIFKNTFQKKAARAKTAIYLRQPDEEITPAGFLRAIILEPAAGQTDNIVGLLQKIAPEQQQWTFRPNQRQIRLSSKLLSAIPESSIEKLIVKYSEGRILPRLTYTHPFREMRLSGGHSLFIERIERFSQSFEDKEKIKGLKAFFTCQTNKTLPPPALISEFESIRGGLQEYY